MTWIRPQSVRTYGILHLEYLPHHALRRAQVPPAKQDEVVKHVVQVVHRLSLLVSRF